MLLLMLLPVGYPYSCVSLGDPKPSRVAPARPDSNVTPYAPHPHSGAAGADTKVASYAAQNMYPGEHVKVSQQLKGTRRCNES